MTAIAALLLVVALAGPAGAQATATVTYEQAVALARRGDLEAALAAFRQIAAATPADHDSRVWIGRLNGWLGDLRAAEDTLGAVLEENPRHVDARVALATVLLNSGRTGAALEMLAPAEQEAPANADVLGALARARYFRGDLTMAVRYIERAAAISSAPEHAALREQILRAFRHHVEITGFGEHFTADIPAAGHGDIALNLRASDRIRVVARGQVQDKFNLREWRAGGGVEWRITGPARLAASVLIGPDTVVLPRTDVNGEFGYARGRFEWVAAARRIAFATADVLVGMPGVYVAVGERLTLNGRYAFASTAFASGPRQQSHSGAVGFAALTGRRVWLSGTYARGTESFETLSPDRIGQFRADTVAGGVRIELPTLSTVAAAYERQWRTRGTHMGRLTITLLHRF